MRVPSVVACRGDARLWSQGPERRDCRDDGEQTGSKHSGGDGHACLLPGTAKYATFRLAHRRAPGTLRRLMQPGDLVLLRSTRSGAGSLRDASALRCSGRGAPRSSIVAPGLRGEPFGGNAYGSTRIGGAVGIRRRTSCGRALTCCSSSVRASRTRSNSSGTSPALVSLGWNARNLQSPLLCSSGRIHHDGRGARRLGGKAGWSMAVEQTRTTLPRCGASGCLTTRPRWRSGPEGERVI